MRFDTIIKGGTVVTTEGKTVADVGINGERIAAIGSDLPVGEARVLDARGMLVLPGAIDCHVHLQLPVGELVSSDDFITGTRAAARGGVTCVIDYANQDLSHGLMAGVHARMQEAEGRVCVDYSLHCVITRHNRTVGHEMDTCVREGITTFKMFTVYEDRGLMSDDGALFAALGQTAQNRGRICVHAENDGVIRHLTSVYLPKKEEVGAYGHALCRPHCVEEEAVGRVLKWAEATGGRLYIVHLSTGGAADLIRRAQEKGVDVVAETCPQYLLLNDELLQDKVNGHLFATCPQLRKPEDQKRLWTGLARGELGIVATDTCTFTSEQKKRWGGDFTQIPFGLPGTETMLPLLWTHGYLAGRISLERLVALVSTNPAKVHGLYPQKGTISVGSDADIILVDPDGRSIIHPDSMETNCDYSPYAGMEVGGFPQTVLLRGREVVRGGSFVGTPGQGRFVKRLPGMGL